MPRDPESPSRLQFHSEPELRPEIRGDRGRVLRNVHGQSLEDAQEEFWGRWITKIREKREELEEAKRRELWCASSRGWLIMRGAGGGAFFVGVRGWFIHQVPGALLGMVWGALAGTLAVVPFIILSLVCETWFHSRAERLARELRELERS